MTDHQPAHAAQIAPQTPEAPAPAPSADPTPQTPEAPGPAPSRDTEDIISGCNELTALEWLAVVRELDISAATVVQNLPLAALALAVVEDARASGFWRWDKFGQMDNTALLEVLGVDIAAASARNPEPYGSGAAVKSD